MARARLCGAGVCEEPSARRRGRLRCRVEGSANLPYTVHVDAAHVRQSYCDCPHAAGTRRICKHMVATVFAAYPQQIDAFKWEVEQAELEYRREEAAHRAELIRYVNSLKKDELRKALLDALIELEERRDRWW